MIFGTNVQKVFLGNQEVSKIFLRGLEIFSSISADPYSDYVTLLAHFNTDSTDSSTNNFQLTAFGNAQISTVEKKYGDGSAYFDGSGDYLELPLNSQFDFGSGDFTIEAWIYLNATPSDYFISSANGSGGLFFGFQNGTSLGWGRAAVAWDYSAASGITTGQWYHVAVSRSGTSMRVFVNGNQIGTTQTNSTSYNLGTGNLAIGAQANNYFLNGYIDDLRITKGVARYTSNFTPPEAQLPTTTDPYYSNVSLLLPMNLGPFTDSSTNNFELTAFGNTDLSTAVKKYGTASVYFDGNGDYVQTIIPNWNVGVSGEPFTIELWAYRLNTSTHVFLTKHGGVAAWNGTNGINFHFYATSSNLIFGFYGGSEITINNSTAIPANQWVHLAVTYDGTTTRVFVDGALQPVTSTTSYQTVTDANILQIAGEVNDSFLINGYIDDLRITKGVARYTSNFTPPTSELPRPSDPNGDNVSLLLHMDGSNGSQTFTDSSTNNFQLTAFGNAQIDTSIKKYGSGAGYFNETLLASVKAPTNSLLSMGTGNFTVECWIYPFDTGQGNNGTVIGGRDGNAFQIGYRNSTEFGIANSFVAWELYSSTIPANNTWTHVAATRDNNLMKLFYNGQLITQGTIPTDYAGFTNEIGGYDTYGGYFNGYIDEVRITKGVARYTSNFVPQTAPFANP